MVDASGLPEGSFIGAAYTCHMSCDDTEHKTSTAEEDVEKRKQHLQMRLKTSVAAAALHVGS